MSSTPVPSPAPVLDVQRSHHNNFDLLRLLAAIDVMALHVVDLSGEASLSFLGWVDTRLALSTFFIISGYLVFQSFEQTPRLAIYLEKRARRILPAYVVVILLSVLLGAALTTLSWEAYFGPQTLTYLISNLLFLNFIQPDLPGVFQGNIFNAVNGALWTIKVEVMFYAAVPIFVWLIRRLGHRPVLIAGFASSCLWWGGMTALAAHTGKPVFSELAKQMPGQLMYFLPGAWCYYERDRLRAMGWPLGAVSLAMLLLAHGMDLSYLYPLALTGCVFYAAFALPYVGRVTRPGDLSYGIYILHFPIIQTLVQLGWFQHNPYGTLLLASALVGVAAWLSWHLVEAPMLRRRTAPVPPSALAT